MNWFAFALAAWICFGLEIGLRDYLSLQSSAVAPSFVIAFLAYIAMHASQRAVLWAAIILGVIVDLTGSIALSTSGDAVLLGPHALGFLLGAQIVLSLRAMIVSRNPLSLGVLSLAVAAVAQIVVVAVLTVHKLVGDPLVWDPSDRLVEGLVSAVYTGIVATLLALLLIPLSPLFGFAHSHRRFGHP
ncbi:MAG: hypothetical protein Kow0022_05930 [Phycisphaerales bacterium]